jgi:hypothetical protein
MLREMRGNGRGEKLGTIIRIQVFLNPVEALELPNEKDDMQPQLHP